ncbi:hypothetical protein D9M68_520690 [compost metagenome]
MQIGALALQPHHLVQVGLHVLRQLAVAQVRPAPSAQDQAQRQHQAEKGQVAHAGLGRAGVLAHQFLVGEDHAGKQFAQEEAIVRGHAARLRARRGTQLEALGQLLGGGALRDAFLQRAGEVETAEHRLVLERIGFEQRGQEGAQRRLDTGKFQREREQARRQVAAVAQRDLRRSHLFQAFVQLVEAAVEQRQYIAVFLGAVGQGCAPDAVALALVAVGEEFAEARDQVGLGEDDVDRREHFQAVGQLLHALAQVLGQVDREFRPGARQFLDAGGHDDAVDRRLGTMALEQVQEAHPFVAVLFMHRVASGRVQQDAFGGEEPVAVARAADPAHRRAVLVGERKLQAGIDDRAALARGRIADHDVPGQLVQGLVARRLPDFRGFDGAHRLGQPRAQRLHVVAVGGGARLHLLFQHVAQVLVGLAGAPPAPQVGAQPQQQADAQGDARPDEADLDGAREQEQEQHQSDQADHHEGTRVGQHARRPMSAFAHRAGYAGKET